MRDVVNQYLPLFRNSTPSQSLRSNGWTMEDVVMDEKKKRKDKKIDKAGHMSFPASDAPAHGKPTSTETPSRPADRKAPRITKEQIDRAQRGEGHKDQRRS
jgi:hypothetical protein